MKRTYNQQRKHSKVHGFRSRMSSKTPSCISRRRRKGKKSNQLKSTDPHQWSFFSLPIRNE
jgi:large subunit ribosomal protein L34